MTDHNRFHFNFVQVLANAFDTLAANYTVRFVSGTTVLFARFKPDNFMHALHDDLLPLFTTIDTFKYDRRELNVLFADDWTHDQSQLPFHEELYKTAIDARSYYHVRQFADNEIVCFEDVHVGLDKTSVWYDYGFHAHQHPIDKSPFEQHKLRSTLRQFRDRFAAEHTTACSSQHVVLLSRSETRRIINEHDLVGVIAEVLSPPLVVRLETINSLVEVVPLLRCAKLVIGMHGSALILSLFMPPGSSVLELFPYAIDPQKYQPYRTLAKLNNMRYASWTNDDVRNSRGFPNNPPELGGIAHLPPEHQQLILSTKTVPEHLCCEDPNWLYHINQDTYVDNSIKKVLRAIAEDDVTVEDDDSSPLLFPGAVEDISCSKSGDLFAIRWRAPWNLEFIPQHGSVVMYDVVVRDAATGVVTTATTNNTQIEMSLLPQSHVWIRCRLSNLQGPFQPQPFTCDVSS